MFDLIGAMSTTRPASNAPINTLVFKTDSFPVNIRHRWYKISILFVLHGKKDHFFFAKHLYCTYSEVTGQTARVCMHARVGGPIVAGLAHGWHAWFLELGEGRRGWTVFQIRAQTMADP